MLFVLYLCLGFLSFTSAFRGYPKYAVAYISNRVSGVHGVVKFIQSAPTSVVRIEVNLKGLSPGYHGFHVHEFGSYGNQCEAAGEHFNPTKTIHGGPMDQRRHVGDLGNVWANRQGIVKLARNDRMIKLSGPYSIIGRSVVVHEKVDDFGTKGTLESLTSGSSGKRIGCGAIDLVRRYQ
ncbi:hypothetical protein K7432_002948 [Basidiobolus ranarum]|uniref:Superoxide dismutase copper/zinc binding domain-containing protein n=1 Tax=Basidiobolus ranarum TaxID=34480 RepID=A0ABR2X0R1_9FUNG